MLGANFFESTKADQASQVVDLAIDDWEQNGLRAVPKERGEMLVISSLEPTAELFVDLFSN